MHPCLPFKGSKRKDNIRKRDMQGSLIGERHSESPKEHVYQKPIDWARDAFVKPYMFSK